MHERQPRSEDQMSSALQKAGRQRSRLALILAVLVLVVSGGVLCFTLLHQEPEYITYRDQQLLAYEGVPRNDYDAKAFIVDEKGWIQYEKGGRQAVQGMDVSYYQGEIDWKAVADSGIEFAMIRVGYRGYSKGTLRVDPSFEANIEGALDAGLKVGVYFFSQATTILEAEEEADFVLETIRTYPIHYPVVYDWEFITNEEARTDDMDGETLTQCAKAFCDLISSAGYSPMVYLNQDMGYLFYQLDQLGDIPIWLAEYDVKPDFYYDFALWQYTHTGSVPGIEGNVDLNLDFRGMG